MLMLLPAEAAAAEAGARRPANYDHGAPEFKWNLPRVAGPSRPA